MLNGDKKFMYNKSIREYCKEIQYNLDLKNKHYNKHYNEPIKVMALGPPTGLVFCMDFKYEEPIVQEIFKII